MVQKEVIWNDIKNDCAVYHHSVPASPLALGQSQQLGLLQLGSLLYPNLLAIHFQCLTMCLYLWMGTNLNSNEWQSMCMWVCECLCVCESMRDTAIVEALVLFSGIYTEGRAQNERVWGVGVFRTTMCAAVTTTKACGLAHTRLK